MCRFTVYKGRPVFLGDILIRPDNSLLVQARDAGYHPGIEDNTHRRNIVVNGDGFGLAWYINDPSKGACCCKFLTPAWSNSNLRNLGEYVSSPLIIGHIRAASSGHNPLEDVAVSTENCHPFKYGRWTFVHNGTIPQFKKMKRAMVLLMKDECFHDISGNTDSECIFALFLSLLPNRDEETTIEQVISTINYLISTILELCSSSNVTEPCSLNLCITDGTNLYATRYRNGPEEPPSLYYKYGSEFKCVDGNLFSCDTCPQSEIIISSAPLSKDCKFHADMSSRRESIIMTQSWYEYNATGSNGNANGNGGSGSDSNSSIGSNIRSSMSMNTTLETYLSRTSLTDDLRKDTESDEFFHIDTSTGTTNEIDNSSGVNRQWTIIPKDHMLICVGDPNDITKVKSVYCQPIESDIGKGLVFSLRSNRRRNEIESISVNSIKTYYSLRGSHLYSSVENDNNSEVTSSVSLSSSSSLSSVQNHAFK